MKKLSVYLCLSMIAIGALAQMPRTRKLDQTGNLYDIRRALAKSQFTRLVTVDSSGMGDYQTITAALAFVAGQTRGSTAQWLVLVYPGVAGTNSNYTEGCLSVPSYTQIKGMMGSTHDGVQGRILVDLTCTTAAAITMGPNSSLLDLALTFRGLNAAATAVVEIPSGTTANLTRIYINHTPTSGGVALPAVLVGGTITSNDLRLFASANAGAVPLVKFTGPGGGSFYGGYLNGSSGCTATYGITGTGTVRLFYTRSGGSCTVDIDAGSAGATVEISGGGWKASTGPSASGTATLRDLLSPVGGSTLPTTCFPGRQYIDNVTPRACWCTALNTWKCVGIS